MGYANTRMRLTRWSCFIGLLLASHSGHSLRAQEAPDKAKYALDSRLDEAPEKLTEKAISIASVMEGIPLTALRIEASARARFPNSGLRAYAFKVMDTVSGDIVKIVLDENGQLVDEEKAKRLEENIIRETYGALEPEILDWVSMTTTDWETLPVMIWLRRSDDWVPQRPNPEGPWSVELMEALFAENDFACRDAISDAVHPLIDDLARRGIVVEGDEYAPVLYASLPKGLLLDLSKHPSVDRIYLQRQSEAQLDVSRTVTGMARAHNVYNAQGQGIRVAQVEVGGDVNLSNPFLPDVTRGSFCGYTDNHGCGVAGIIQSTHGTHRGYAPGSRLFAGSDCYGGWAQLQSLATAAANWGAQAINLSFGADIGNRVGGQDRFYDALVFNRVRSVVVAAGNYGGGTDQIASPAMGYNVISVGNFDDRGTNSWAINNYTTTWNDDMMRGSSSFKDPVSTFGDREKPELSAPGSNITMTSKSWPWLNYTSSGTSFAAPAVTGTIASMLGQNVNLPGWPEAIRAILMATALNNIEGSARLSDKDGAGGMDSYAAVRCARRTQGGWGGYSYNCWSPSSIDVTRMYLSEGRRTRMAISWQTDPGYWNYANEPSADLDLHVLDPNGRIVTTSGSFDNTKEIVDFVAPVSGYYTLRVNRYTCTGSQRAFGWAWY